MRRRNYWEYFVGRGLIKGCGSCCYGTKIVEKTNTKVWKIPEKCPKKEVLVNFVELTIVTVEVTIIQGLRPRVLRLLGQFA